MAKLYKCLGPDRTACHSGSGQWLPVGEWMPPIEGDLVPCTNGYHVCTFEQLLGWLSAELYEVEVRGDRVDEDNKSVVREACLAKRCEWWTERTARLFACDCAEHVLPLCEKAAPGDMRPRRAIEVARLFADGKATREELAAAWSAAWSAAGSAAWPAERRWQLERLSHYRDGDGAEAERNGEEQSNG